MHCQRWPVMALLTHYINRCPFSSIDADWFSEQKGRVTIFCCLVRQWRHKEIGLATWLLHLPTIAPTLHMCTLFSPKLGRRSCASAAANDQLRQAESKATGRKRKSAVIRQKDRACCFSFSFLCRDWPISVFDCPWHAGRQWHKHTHIYWHSSEKMLLSSLKNFECSTEWW